MQQPLGLNHRGSRFDWREIILPCHQPTQHNPKNCHTGTTPGYSVCQTSASEGSAGKCREVECVSRRAAVWDFPLCHIALFPIVKPVSSLRTGHSKMIRFHEDLARKRQTVARTSPHVFAHCITTSPQPNCQSDFQLQGVREHASSNLDELLLPTRRPSKRRECCHQNVTAMSSMDSVCLC